VSPRRLVSAAFGRNNMHLPESMRHPWAAALRRRTGPGGRVFDWLRRVSAKCSG